MQPQVYFIIECPFTDKVKIGKSINSKKRLSTLQTGNSTPLAILFVINCENDDTMNKLETTIHRELRETDKHILGEWFSLNLTEIFDLYKKYKDYKIEQDNLVEPTTQVQNVINIEVNVTINKEPEEGNKKCYDCGKEFRTPAEYIRHKQRKIPCIIREVAPENINNPNRCIYCNRIFTTIGNKNKHLNSCKLRK